LAAYKIILHVSLFNLDIRVRSKIGGFLMDSPYFLFQLYPANLIFYLGVPFQVRFFAYSPRHRPPIITQA